MISVDIAGSEPFICLYSKVSQYSSVYVCVIYLYMHMIGRSPIRYEGLEVGEYRFQVLPVGCDNEGKRLSVKFDIF